MRTTLALLGLLGLLGMLGCGGQQSPGSASSTAAGRTPANREITIAVTDRGFEPARAVIRRGEAVTLVITRKTDQTCATEVMFPRLNKRLPLPLNRPVRVEIPAGVVKDTLNYACGMNMLAGTIVAE